MKVCAPTGEFVPQAEAFQLFAGRRAVQVLTCDPSNEVLLLECLQPGTPLSCSADDAQAISLAATVMRQLWRSVPPRHPFPSVLDWGAGFGHLRQRYGGEAVPCQEQSRPWENRQEVVTPRQGRRFGARYVGIGHV